MRRFQANVVEKTKTRSLCPKAFPENRVVHEIM